MNIRNIIRIVSVGLASCFVADAAYALYQGASINSTNVLLDTLGVSLSTVALFVLPIFFSVNSEANTPDIWPDLVTPGPSDEPTQEELDAAADQAIYEVVDAVRLLMAHDCVTTQHKSILGDIIKCILTKGNDSCVD